MIIEIDTKGWSQEQKNMMKAHAVSILKSQNIEYERVVIDKNYRIDVINPSEDPTGIITPEALNSFYSEWKLQNDAMLLQQTEENSKRKSAIEASQLNQIKVDDIESIIDGLKDLDEIKSFLKDFVKYTIARMR